MKRTYETIHHVPAKLILSWLSLIVVGIAYLATATLKSGDLAGLQKAIVRSHLLPDALVPIVAYAVVSAEAAVAILLCYRSTRSFALFLATMMSLFFGGYSLWRQLRHIPAPCHCFGLLFQMSPLQGLGVSLMLAALSLLAWRGLKSQSGSRMRGEKVLSSANPWLSVQPAGLFRYPTANASRNHFS